MHQSPSGLVELTNHKEARQEVTVIGSQDLHENNPFSGAVRPHPRFILTLCRLRSIK
jgi:hypothetical protein